jgi:hypothetical protein
MQVSKKISGIRKLMTNLATADECPSMFVIVPDLSVKDVCSGSSSTQNPLLNTAESMLTTGGGRLAAAGAISADAEESLLSWTTALQDIFTGQLSLMEVADTVYA